MNRIVKKMIQLKNRILNNREETYSPSNNYINVLSSKELQQLQVFDKVDRFNQVFKTLKIKDKKCRKKDALWTVYNECRIEYEYAKDLSMLSIVFDRQVEILVNDKKALDTYTTSLYCLLYNYDCFNNDINLFDRHLNNRRIERIKMLLKNYKQSTVAGYFQIINKNEHRAVSYAEVCGEILDKFLDYEIKEK